MVYLLHCTLDPSQCSIVYQLINKSVMIFNNYDVQMFLPFYLFFFFFPRLQVQEANAQLAEQDAEVTPVQRRIEPRSADDSLSGVVRCLCFADTFLRDGMNKSVLCSSTCSYFPARMENQNTYTTNSLLSNKKKKPKSKYDNIPI